MHCGLELQLLGRDFEEGILSSTGLVEPAAGAEALGRWRVKVSLTRTSSPS